MFEWHIYYDGVRALGDGLPVDAIGHLSGGVMPGYKSDLLMAGGTFIDGSTSEFSADAPLRAPYNLYVQGGSHHSQIKIALSKALVALVQADLIDWTQNM